MTAQPAEPDDGEAIGVYWDDPLHIMSSDPPGGNFIPVDRPECTCPAPGRWALYVKHNADPFTDPGHECREPRPRTDWREVLDGLKVWRR